MDTIVKAVPLDNYRIDILASSGISGIFDVKLYLNGSAFKELENKSYFVSFALLIMALGGPMNRILVLIPLSGIYKMPNHLFDKLLNH